MILTTVYVIICLVARSVTCAEIFLILVIKVFTSCKDIVIIIDTMDVSQRQESILYNLEYRQRKECTLQSCGMLE